MQNYDPKIAFEVTEKVFEELNISLSQIKSTLPEFLELQRMFPSSSSDVFWGGLPENKKFFVMYFYLTRQMFSSFGVSQSSWNPEQGPEGLMDTLRTQGALLVSGKYGPCFHGGGQNCVELNDYNTEGRKVLGFKPDTYVGDQGNWTHAVIIDQVRIINGKYRVFFRDPYFDSVPNGEELVFCLSYETFIERLYHLDCSPYRAGDRDSNFLLYSSEPYKLLNAPLEVETRENTSSNLSYYMGSGLLMGALGILCYGAYRYWTNNQINTSEPLNTNEPSM